MIKEEKKFHRRSGFGFGTIEIGFQISRESKKQIIFAQRKKLASMSDNSLDEKHCQEIFIVIQFLDEKKFAK